MTHNVNTASTLFAIGAGGTRCLYGEAPSLTKLDRAGNLVPTVDFRSVYAGVSPDPELADEQRIFCVRSDDGSRPVWPDPHTISASRAVTPRPCS